MKNSYYKVNPSIEELEEDLSNNMLNASLDGNMELLNKTLNFAKYNNLLVDLSYRDGLCPVLAAQKGNYEVLETFINYDKSLISTYGTEMLAHAASHGQIKCVKFLLEHGANPLELKGTTAYNNYQEVETLFNQYLTEHKVEPLGEIHPAIDNAIE